MSKPTRDVVVDLWPLYVSGEASPDTRALVEAAPQAGRLLRPLCRALAIDPPAWLRLPGTPEPPPPRPSPARRTWPPSVVAPAPIGPFPTPPYRQIFG